jgi:hypothetical protein
MKYIKLFEGFVDDNEKTYNKVTYSPIDITIELTEDGKQYIEKQLKAWVKQSKPDIQTGGYLPDTNISVRDKVKIKASYFGGPNDSGRGEEKVNLGKMVNIGEIEIKEQPGTGGGWVSDSPLTKTGENDGKQSSSKFIIFARYFPLEDESGKGAKISLTKSIYKKDQWSEKANPMQTLVNCEFSKVEAGEVDDRGYFKIVEVK